MLVGVPKETKNNEYRVGMTPSGVRELVGHGHRVLVQSDAGIGVGLADKHYTEAGAEVVMSASEVFGQAELIVKVKEPQHQELGLLRPGQILFAYLHLAPDPEQTKGLITADCVAIAYETVTASGGGLPLLAPMSQVAGRMSIQAGATCLEKSHGGAGVLLGGVPGVAAGRVVIFGGGVVGCNAAQMAVGLGADVTVIDRSLERLAYLDACFGNRIHTIHSTAAAIEEYAFAADLVVGAVLVPGAATPKLLARSHLAHMRPGSVLVDVAIDQGGCFETSRPTTHDHPTYIVDDIVHYCVANMPGAVARTSTFALTNATLPFVLALADKGCQQALLDDANLRMGLNIHRGEVTCFPVATRHGYNYVEPLTSIRSQSAAG